MELVKYIDLEEYSGVEYTEESSLEGSLCKLTLTMETWRLTIERLNLQIESFTSILECFKNRIKLPEVQS